MLPGLAEVRRATESDRAAPGGGGRKAREWTGSHPVP